MTTNIIHNENAKTGLPKLPAGIARTCVTSPPYFGLRDYGHPDQIGLEETPEQYIANLVEVFRGVKHALTEDGTLWVNIGDSYSQSAMSAHSGERASRSQNAMFGKRRKAGDSLKPKDLIGIPWMLAFALRADGWYLRQDIIWHKPNPMPESVTDRCTKSHEYIFLLSKSERYYYDFEAVKEKAIHAGKISYNGGTNGMCDGYDGHRTRAGLATPKQVAENRNMRSVWSIPVRPFKDAHFATFPPDLITPCIQAGSAIGDIVLDPFMGSGTTAEVSLRLDRQYIGFELNTDYIAISDKRLSSHKNNLFTI